ncbi:SH3 domain-containing protein 1 [Tanacetum coccineum]
MFDLFLESFQTGNQTQKFLNYLVVAALDQKAYTRCLKLHNHSYYLSTDGVDFSQEADFMVADYLKMMWRRIHFLGNVLDLGYNFVFTDADIMWFRDPFPHFHEDGDFQIACDYFRGNPNDLNNLPNGGFTYVKSNNKTIQFYKYWYDSRLTYPGLHDQDVFNKIKFDPFIRDNGLQIRFLDTAFFGGFCEPSRDFGKVCTMHANCCVGLENKVHDLGIMLQDWRKYMHSFVNHTAFHDTVSWTVPQSCSNDFTRAYNVLHLYGLHEKLHMAVLSRLSKDAEIFDNEELQCHQKLQDLYRSTRETKHFQKDIVRGVEGFVSISQKEKQIAKRLAEDCCRYGTENVNADFPLTRAAVELGTSYTSIEDKRETMLEIFNNQVSEPLRASIRCAPLEDARHLARSCDRLRQEVETQAVEVLRRQTKVRDPTPESASKLRNMETKLSDLRTSMVTLQKEAISAMLSVEEQQQQVTLQKLILMVDAERSYHRHVVAILEELHTEMILEMKLQESSQSASEKDNLVPSGDAIQHEHNDHQTENQEYDYFIGKVIHPFDAQADGELSLIVDDYVIVRKVNEARGAKDTLRILFWGVMHKRFEVITSWDFCYDLKSLLSNVEQFKPLRFLKRNCLSLNSLFPLLLDSAANVLAEWNAVYDAHNEELKSMFEKQAEVERFDLIQTFHACKQDEGIPVGPYVIKIKNYVAPLEHLGYVLPRDLSVGFIMNGLISDFAGFVRDYNKHNMGKTIGELHALLIEYEKGKGKGKDKSYIPKPKNPKPSAKEHPAKDDACHHCKEVGHYKRNCLAYLAKLIKKKKQVGTASSSNIFIIELFPFPTKS